MISRPASTTKHCEKQIERITSEFEHKIVTTSIYSRTWNWRNTNTQSTIHGRHEIKRNQSSILTHDSHISTLYLATIGPGTGHAHHWKFQQGQPLQLLQKAALLVPQRNCHLHCTVARMMGFFTFFSLPRKKPCTIQTKVCADCSSIVLFLQLISLSTNFRIFSSSIFLPRPLPLHSPFLLWKNHFKNQS